MALKKIEDGALVTMTPDEEQRHRDEQAATAAAALPLARAAARADINDQAEAARRRWITPGDGQALVYQAKHAEALQWRAILAAGGTPDPAHFPLLAERAQRLNPGSPDHDAVAQEWVAKAAAWTDAAARIEAVRETALAAADTAPDLDTLAALFPLTWPAPTA